MSFKEHSFDIVISGAGAAGLCLSLLLAKAGFDIALIDPAPLKKQKNDVPSGRTVALLNSSLNVLKAALGIKEFKNWGTPLKTMRIVDDSGHKKNQIEVKFYSSDIGHSEFGFNIPNAFVLSMLGDAVLNNDKIKIFPSSKLKSFETNGLKILAQTDQGNSISAKLIIGTDGRNSVVRDVAGIHVKRHDYDQTAMTCLISHSKPHNFTSTEFHRAGGPFTFVPMDENYSSVVWVEKTEDAKKILSMKRQEFQQAIQDRSHGLLGTINLESNPESWPLMMLSAEKIIGDRCALAAEAAHVLSPIGAQGLNLSLRDVATLAEILIDAARIGEDIGCENVLTRYQKRRVADIKSHVIGIDGLNRAVANDLSFIADFRRLGLKGLNTIPFLKNFVMGHGLNPKIDEGRIISGGQL